MNPEPAAFRAGMVAVIGRPNVGKSTLVNALVGHKVSITAPRPQTTRHRIMGVATDAGAQIVLLDTPGLHPPGKHAISRQLNRTARSTLGEVDAALWVVEAGRWLDADAEVWRSLADSGLPVVVAVNKIDKLARHDALLPFLAQVTAGRALRAAVPVSALARDGLDRLRAELAALLPVAPAIHAPEVVTDRSERFIASELIREQLMRQLREELPYAAAVVLDDWQEDDQGGLRLEATIFVEREAQKAIVVGAGGQQIRAIGTAARHAIGAALDRKVHLALWCKVRGGWSDDEAALARFGYAD